MMLRKVLGSVIALVVFCGFVSAENLKGKITKIEGKTITFMAKEKGKKGFGEAKEYTLADNCKVMQKLKKKEMKELEGGLQNKLLTKLGKKGRFAMIVTNEDGQVTQIIVSGGGGKKGNKKKVDNN